MKKAVYKFVYSFPVQLLLLHFRRYQVLLLFWLVLFSTINGSFARMFGAISLFLAPEYLGSVNFYSTFILGGSIGLFIMSWNITTFILHSKRFRFLATTNHPFAKYCMNNAVIPLAFIIFLFVKGFIYQRYNELNSMDNTILLLAGMLLGILFFLFISFTYFFNANRTILKSIQKQMGGPRKLLQQIKTKEKQSDDDALKVDNYLNTFLKAKHARNVDHYDRRFLQDVFRRHHFAAVLTLVIAFVFLVIMSYLTSYPAFRIPAAASILIFFSVLIGFSGAFAYLLGTWTIPVLVVVVLLINLAIKKDIIDTRSKAYGLDYRHRDSRPPYSFGYLDSLFTVRLAAEDKKGTIATLDRWKNKFKEKTKPKLVVINLSGGGSRSATWCMDVLQYADSILDGNLMSHTVLMTGASGGMIAAAYFRELYWEKLQGRPIDLYNSNYVENVSRDLLNSIMSSFAINDFFTPFQRFRLDSNVYSKDRGYAFERQLNINTGDALDKTIGYYAKPVREALIPMILFTPTITADGRKLLICSQPVSYMTWPEYQDPGSNSRDIDAIDFGRYFAAQHAGDLRLTTAIRMSATFPYVLPNVYLPTRPIIDVMDAGLRDNFGQETSLRFLHVFRAWINENTSGVISIVIRDSRKNQAMPIRKEKALPGMIMEPLFTIQRSWSDYQDFEQDDLTAYAEHFFRVPFSRIILQYVPKKGTEIAALNWHLTGREKTDIDESLLSPANRDAFRRLVEAMKP
jgi:hypothetical protein